MLSLYQCWPGKKDVDLTSIEVQRFCVNRHYQLQFIEHQTYREDVEVYACLFVSGFQVLELVPGVFVHAGLRRPPKVHSEQHYLEATS